MNQWRIVRLNFGTHPVHFGEVGIGIEETTERVRSDTLYSAIMSLYARLYDRDRLQTLINRFITTPKSPPFRLSSSFLYRQIEPRSQTIFYLPTPLSRPNNYPIHDDLSIRKAFQKLEFLPLNIWQRWYQGSGISLADIQEIKQQQTQEKNRSRQLEQAGLFDYKQAFRRNVVPKVALDRVTHASNFYHTGFVKFNNDPTKEQSGLYFLIQLPDESSAIESELYSVITLLGEEGLGGERSSGAGQFEIKDWMNPADADPQKPWLQTWNSVLNHTQGNHHSLISLFWQKKLPPDLITPTTRYTIQERGGWAIGVAQRRHKVHMLTEGSVFSIPPIGELAPVTPSTFKTHEIYRSGISLSLPIAIAEEAI